MVWWKKQTTENDIALILFVTVKHAPPPKNIFDTYSSPFYIVKL